MRFVSTDKVFIGDGQILKKGVISFDEAGLIHQLFADRNDPEIPEGALEVLPGIICPGFVNAHCHLELSHLKGALRQGTGLPSFLTGVTKLRAANPTDIQDAMTVADKAMFDNGINLVGDISNGTDSINVKKPSKIQYHTFIEVFGLTEELADQKLEYGVLVLDEFERNGLNSSVSPHATYSLSDTLRHKLAEHNAETEKPISIHNQETESEDELFIRKTGKLQSTFSDFGISMDGLAKTGLSSLQSTLSGLETCGPLLLVHNSFTDSEDMTWAIEKRKNLFWCSCPSANLYIELRSPKVSEWLKTGAQVCLGTDSLASNHKLSILKEMELTQTRSPEISLDQLITMATFNGAKALGQHEMFGQLSLGTSPGILHLSGNDIDRGRITDQVKLKRLA
ncbi:MAG: cytosine/adenosine deaminase-related metal-dependent hydrolase [Bacteroidia bacterium]|jgi:cytosine/adenosine deaminase-related metal-dependent hydrolase